MRSRVAKIKISRSKNVMEKIQGRRTLYGYNFPLAVCGLTSTVNPAEGAVTVIVTSMSSPGFNALALGFPQSFIVKPVGVLPVVVHPELDSSHIGTPFNRSWSIVAGLDPGFSP